MRESVEGHEDGSAAREQAICLFVCGDVMTGRGIDQILPHPGRPRLFEPSARSATEYVKLAEEATGPLPSRVGHAYPWGDALAVLAQRQPHARIINLETAVTTSDAHWPSKLVHYRMHPANLPCLTQAGIDCCVLANNHVLDWGHEGLDETLESLHKAGIRTAGAGRNAAEAATPAAIDIAGHGRILVYAYAGETGGVPKAWAATPRQDGVNFLSDLSTKSADAIARHVARGRHAGDVVVISLHWGSNWGFDVSRSERAFAHHLIVPRHGLADHGELRAGWQRRLLVGVDVARDLVQADARNAGEERFGARVCIVGHDHSLLALAAASVLDQGCKFECANGAG